MCSTTIVSVVFLMGGPGEFNIVPTTCISVFSTIVLSLEGHSARYAWCRGTACSRMPRTSFRAGSAMTRRAWRIVRIAFFNRFSIRPHSTEKAHRFSATDCHIDRRIRRHRVRYSRCCLLGYASLVCTVWPSACIGHRKQCCYGDLTEVF